MGGSGRMRAGAPAASCVWSSTPSPGSRAGCVRGQWRGPGGRLQASGPVTESAAMPLTTIMGGDGRRPPSGRGTMCSSGSRPTPEASPPLAEVVRSLGRGAACRSDRYMQRPPLMEAAGVSGSVSPLAAPSGSDSPPRRRVEGSNPRGAGGVTVRRCRQLHPRSMPGADGASSPAPRHRLERESEGRRGAPPRRTLRQGSSRGPVVTSECRLGGRRV